MKSNADRQTHYYNPLAHVHWGLIMVKDNQQKHGKRKPAVVKENQQKHGKEKPAETW